MEQEKTLIAASFVGWVRDRKGNVTKRTLRPTSPTITTFIGGGYNMNTTPTILEIWKKQYPVQ